ncbi:MAG: DUF4249 family protein [Bacteroidota bacterium]
MKIKHLFLIPGVILGLLVHSSCIDRIDFSGPPAPINLVVSGIITNSPGQRTIHLSYQRPIDIFQTRDTIPPPATINLFEDGVLIAPFIQLATDEYRLDESAVIEAEKAYHIEIQFVNGDTYASRPELVRPLHRVDSLGLQFEQRDIDSQVGSTIRRWFVDLYVFNWIPPSEEPYYFRWEMDEDWEQVELAREDPFDIQLTCYFHTPRTSLPVRIQTTKELESGVVSKRIIQRQPGDAFKDRHVFNVYQHRISPEAYAFYEQLDLLVNRTGNMFDQIPAAVTGNVSNLNAPDERVLGYVEFSLADTSRLWVRRQMFPFTIRLSCADPDIASTSCFECILNNGASYNKPYYWP